MIKEKLIRCNKLLRTLHAGKHSWNGIEFGVFISREFISKR